MAQEKPNPLTEWLHAVRAQVPILCERAGAWLRAIREEPALVWQTPAVRYAAFGLLALVVVLGIRTGIGMITLPLPPEAGQAATSADFHVICSKPDCGQHFVIHRELGFRKFPVACTKCREVTGASARRCHSSTCRGRWVAAEKRDNITACPHCGAEFR